MSSRSCHFCSPGVLRRPSGALARWIPPSHKACLTCQSWKCCTKFNEMAMYGPVHRLVHPSAAKDVHRESERFQQAMLLANYGSPSVSYCYQNYFESTCPAPESALPKASPYRLSSLAWQSHGNGNQRRRTSGNGKNFRRSEMGVW